MTEPVAQEVREVPTVHLRPALALVANVAAAAGETVVALGAGSAVVVAAAATAATGMAWTVVRRRQGAIRRARAGGRSRFGGSTSGGRTGGGIFSGRRYAGGRTLFGRGTGTGTAAGTPSRRGATTSRGATPRGGSGGGTPGAGGTSRGRTAGRRWPLGRSGSTGAGKSHKTGPGGLDPKKTKTDPVKPAAKKTPPVVATTVRRGTGPTTPGTTTAPKPVPATTGRRTTPGTDPATPVRRDVVTAAASAGTTGGRVSTSPMRHMIETVEGDFMKQARKYDPQGIEEILDEYRQWSELLLALMKVWHVMRVRSDEEHPLKPAVGALIGEIEKTQAKVAKIAETIPGLILRLHREDFEKLGDRRHKLWDHHSNPNTAAK